MHEWRIVASLTLCVVACGPAAPEPGASEPATTSTSTGDAPTTGSSDPVLTTAAPDLPALDPEAVCLALCTKQSLCSGAPIPEYCVQSCLDPPGLGGDECFAANVVYSACLAELACDEFDDPYACEDALRPLLTPCRVCWTHAEWPDEETCWYHEVCAEWTHHIDCDAEKCTCSLDGEIVGVCPEKGCGAGGPSTSTRERQVDSGLRHT